MPFYLKENKKVLARKINPESYKSTLEQARQRFEE